MNNNNSEYYCIRLSHVRFTKTKPEMLLFCLDPDLDIGYHRKSIRINNSSPWVKTGAPQPLSQLSFRPLQNFKLQNKLSIQCFSQHGEYILKTLLCVFLIIFFLIYVYRIYFNFLQRCKKTVLFPPAPLQSMISDFSCVRSILYGGILNVKFHN